MSEDKPLGVSGGGREGVGDRTLDEVVMAAGAEREGGSMREESDRGDNGGVGGRDILGEAGDGLKRDLSRHHIWNTWKCSACKAICALISHIATLSGPSTT